MKTSLQAKPSRVAELRKMLAGLSNSHQLDIPEKARIVSAVVAIIADDRRMFLEQTTLYNRVVSAMLSHVGEIELRLGDSLSALRNLEESVTCQKRSVQLEQDHRPYIDALFGWNKQTINDYENELAEHFGKLVVALLRLDQYEDAADRVDEFLSDIGHNQAKLENFRRLLSDQAAYLAEEGAVKVALAAWRDSTAPPPSEPDHTGKRVERRRAELNELIKRVDRVLRGSATPNATPGIGDRYSAAAAMEMAQVTKSANNAEKSCASVGSD